MSWSGIARVVMALTVLLATPAAAQEGPENRALLDTKRTNELLAHAKDVSEQLFTYDYTDLRKHDAAFVMFTTGEFRAKYSDLFGDLVTQATDMRLSVTSTVKDAAVRVLTDDTAEVLVFLDQSNIRGDTGGTFGNSSMFLATFQHVDGDWKVSDLDLFGGGA